MLFIVARDFDEAIPVASSQLSNLYTSFSRRQTSVDWTPHSQPAPLIRGQWSLHGSAADWTRLRHSITHVTGFSSQWLPPHVVVEAKVLQFGITVVFEIVNSK